MESIWTSTVTMPHFPTLNEDVQTDVLIIGGGMACLLCAHQLQQAGVSCMVVEASFLASGITKNTTAKITSQHGLIYRTLVKRLGVEQARRYWQANQDALNALRRLCQQIDYDFSTQDCMTLDGIPYIGQYSARTPNLYVATGFNKWGMTSSMVAARLLTDLITGKDNPDASLFSPSRSILRPQLGINAWEATRNLLTPTPKRCPHMGCALKWNPQEHSWDCPCHGSRFTEDGKLIDNPATGDLSASPDTNR